ncbi:uncharacterized protein BDW70DRAFT_140153 [Aspergillus foveolatus]|uniref:uncharacterized protein n=1 Tax=Aspergillus foveolatus TaxID=210207 RepID=UPI003CCE06EA
MDQRPEIYINWEFSTTTRRNDCHGIKMNPYNYSTVAGRISKWKTTLKLDHDIPLRINSTDYDITLEADTEQLAQSWQFSEEELSVDFADKVHNLATKSFFADEDMTRAVVAQTKEELRKNIPTLTFGEMGLGFFLTTNLLNPGAKVIRIDEKVGFRVPGNLLLVGHVVQGQDNIKSGKT